MANSELQPLFSREIRTLFKTNISVPLNSSLQYAHWVGKVVFGPIGAAKFHGQKVLVLVPDEESVKYAKLQARNLFFGDLVEYRAGTELLATDKLHKNFFKLEIDMEIVLKRY
jgi:hypothetical protein